MLAHVGVYSAAATALARGSWLGSARAVRGVPWVLLLTGCFGLLPAPTEPTSLGTTSDGWLAEGVPLADEGRGFERVRRGEGTRFGVPRLVAALGRAAAALEESFGAGSTLLVGDIGARFGGHHLRHRSHRAGRDVDILFLLADAAGWPIPSRSHWFNRFGFAEDPDTGRLVYFDEPRNWHLVRTLLADPEIEVQWIFCSRGVKARLLAWAMLNEPDADLLLRASYVLQQPENALPHDDHFHLRIFCSAEERAAGCIDVGPRWPWLRPALEEIEGRDGRGLDDRSLLERLEAP
jgi:penicillin-insensitive murein endopeptidase